ncbi:MULTISPECIES: GNAT family N-acetyltransferase [Fischerella]|uniref:GNAT family N-acetyltransferase n=2 Tax=Fischerella TaxID=1190 RepID=A0A2N6JYZ2_FISMU|nr:MULTISPECIES: GNAT family N-acetyltransferase [Fischerella]PLZ86379.1 GNAT family N-acetyltransferase [Fischerella muscicola CCMEE 5323]
MLSPDLNSLQFSTRFLNTADILQLAEFCIICNDFFELVEKQTASENTAREILQARPSAVPPDNKIVLGFETDKQLVAVVELLRDYPQQNTWFVGLLLLLPEYRCSGYGTQLWQAIEKWIGEAGATEVKLIVQEQNPRARLFWERMGFSFEASVTQVLLNGENRVARLRKTLTLALAIIFLSFMR